MMSRQIQPTLIALDSNTLTTLFRHHALDVYRQVDEGRLRVYVPIIVYAEKAIYPKMPIDNVIEALNARVAPLKIEHARFLGHLWQTLPDPFRQQRKRELWRPHRFDWLIAAMVRHEGWTLVTEDQGPAFSIEDLNTLGISEFVEEYLLTE